LVIVDNVLNNVAAKYDVLETAISYRFSNRRLLEEALTHRSRANEVSGGAFDNQRLEFFGDSILGFLIGGELFHRHPDLREGDLSRLRAVLVDEENLSRLAKVIDLGAFLILGKGEERSGGRNKKSILADAYEALIAAVYLDGGMEAVQDLIKKQFDGLLTAAGSFGLSRDYKTELQELTQSRFSSVPRYELVEASGPDHDRTYRVQVVINGTAAGEGSGKSKKDAQQAAARAVLEMLL
jgi:ribonuclease-3